MIALRSTLPPQACLQCPAQFVFKSCDKRTSNSRERGGSIRADSDCHLKHENSVPQQMLRIATTPTDSLLTKLRSRYSIQCSTPLHPHIAGHDEPCQLLPSPNSAVTTLFLQSPTQTKTPPTFTHTHTHNLTPIRAPYHSQQQSSNQKKYNSSPSSLFTNCFDTKQNWTAMQHIKTKQVITS